MTCRVYWGHSACDLPAGHDPGVVLRVHRQAEPSEQARTVLDAYLFGEDLTAAEVQARIDSWGD